MDELGLLLIPRVIGKDVKESINAKGASVYFTELLMEYTWINAEDPNETITCPWYGQGIDTAGEKGVGKALTYAEKYFMLKFFNIPTDKDDPDAFQKKHGQDDNERVDLISEKDAQAIRDLLSMSTSYTEKDFCSQAKIAKIEDLPSARFKGAFNYLQGLIKAELDKAA